MYLCIYMQIKNIFEHGYTSIYWNISIQHVPWRYDLLYAMVCRILTYRYGQMIQHIRKLCTFVTRTMKTKKNSKTVRTTKNKAFLKWN